MLKNISEFIRSLVRPIVTVGLVGLVGAMAWQGKLGDGFTEVMTLTTAAVAFWFAARPNEER